MRPSSLKAVLFDFDGTLCDTEGHNLALIRGILHAMGAPVTDAELAELAGGDDRVTVPPLLARYGATGTIDDYERERDGCYRTYAEADLALEPGARELVASLRSRGVATALVSTTVARCLLTALDRLRALDLFDVVVTGDMVARRKPHPDPYLRALELLGVDAVDALVVEDSPTGIAAAHAAGCHAIGYAGCSVEQDLSSADEVVSSYVGLEL
ncbi:HAD family hydrolase [Olsenella profusa]|uniref:HAD family phosphatase n=1 Tax=Olsenella profusa TaxID=138595 RepID=A0ABS2F1Y3_9ACTN|nr:HAD family phosphatase [Olsenella profusa]MBM6774991.1 HAD family phosphatase [Olsenella profusa]